MDKFSMAAKVNVDHQTTRVFYGNQNNTKMFRRIFPWKFKVIKQILLRTILEWISFLENRISIAMCHYHSITFSELVLCKKKHMQIKE